MKISYLLEDIIGPHKHCSRLSGFLGVRPIRNNADPHVGLDGFWQTYPALYGGPALLGAQLDVKLVLGRDGVLAHLHSPDVPHSIDEGELVDQRKVVGDEVGAGRLLFLV